MESVYFWHEEFPSCAKHLLHALVDYLSASAYNGIDGCLAGQYVF